MDLALYFLHSSIIRLNIIVLSIMCCSRYSIESMCGPQLE